MRFSTEHKTALLLFALIMIFSAGCKKEDIPPEQTNNNNSNTNNNNNNVNPEWAEPCTTGAVEFRMVDVGDVSLNVACKGEGPVMVLLHGFPEFWYGWNSIIDSLSKNYRLIIPDQRGYNLSDKPDSLSAYKAEHLTSDIAGLIRKVSVNPVMLVGHDWGGVIAWLVAHHHPELIKALVILNAPHPDIFRRELENNPDQQSASTYITLIQSPLAESVLSANNYDGIAGFMSGVLTPEEVITYKEAWSQPGALTAMLNWYRASYDNGNMNVGDSVTISMPTLVLWGMQDVAILPGNLNGLEAYVSDIEIKTFANAGHFIAHEIPQDVVNAVMLFAAEQGYE
jgi:pimeloyl-ACP methyl ester carboxylesterase